MSNVALQFLTTKVRDFVKHCAAMFEKDKKARYCENKNDNHKIKPKKETTNESLFQHRQSPQKPFQHQRQR